MKCEMCDSAVLNRDEILCCSICSMLSHPKCVGIREEKFRNYSSSKRDSWKCPKCSINANIPNDKTNETLVKESSQFNITKQSEVQVNQLDAINNQLDALKVELKSFIAQQIAEVIKSIDFNSDSIKTLTSKNEKLEKEICSLNSTVKSVMNENIMLKSKVDQLTVEVVELQQYSRRTNMEISELPETENEDLAELTNKILEDLDVKDACEVLATHRVPTRNPLKIKPIIVQFQSKTAKEKCLQAAKAKKLKAKDVNPKFPENPIFFNEHLCPAIKSLFFEARKFKRNNNYKFCWVRDSKIFLRQTESSKAIRIKSLTDIPSSK